MKDSATPLLRRVAFLSSSLPRQCGIATFAGDLCESLEALGPPTIYSQVAVNDIEEGYEYPPRVRFEIREKEVASYRRAADFLNIGNVDVVSLQHEYGLFGGPAGSHVLALLRDLRMSVVTTVHTVLREPDAAQRKVMEELAQLSDRLVVMSRRGADFLRDIYKVPPEKVEFIPHGIPDVPFVDPSFYKDQFGLEGKTVLLTFGLLSPSKGIETVIEALPGVLKHFPNVVYVVLGATHPHLKRREGEAYRLSLEQLVQERGVEASVVFHNRFVARQELIEFLGAADIYVSPYPRAAQITSGTLAYAVGTGKAVVSTPYWYAEELLAEDRGALVPFGDPAAIAEQVCELLGNETHCNAMRKRAYLHSREMIWPAVAQRYAECFARAKAQRTRQVRPGGLPMTLDKRPRELPVLNLSHLRRLTDDTGIIQHAVFTVPDLTQGHTTDDNARALILAALLEELEDDASQAAEELATRYMAFLWYAFDAATGCFRNFLSYERHWLDDKMPEDGHGRALWALGTVLGRSRQEGLRGPAGRLFHRALRPVESFTSPRAWAFAILAIHEYLRRFSGDREAQRVRGVLADRLLGLYAHNHSPDWPWFEDCLSYANGKLSHAMLLCGRWLSRPDMTAAGFESLEWLLRVQRAKDGHFAPIGTNSFWRRGGQCARFDQQPVEAYTMISACLEAYLSTGDERWRREAQVIFDWFLGRNDLRHPLYDPTSGGCRDGLHPDRSNQNQGAESSLAFLLSLVEMRLAENIIQE